MNNITKTNDEQVMDSIYYDLYCNDYDSILEKIEFYERSHNINGQMIVTKVKILESLGKFSELIEYINKVIDTIQNENITNFSIGNINLSAENFTTRSILFKIKALQLMGNLNDVVCEIDSMQVDIKLKQYLKERNTLVNAYISKDWEKCLLNIVNPYFKAECCIQLNKYQKALEYINEFDIKEDIELRDLNTNIEIFGNSNYQEYLSLQIKVDSLKSFALFKSQASDAIILANCKQVSKKINEYFSCLDQPTNFFHPIISPRFDFLDIFRFYISLILDNDCCLELFANIIITLFPVAEHVNYKSKIIEESKIVKSLLNAKKVDISYWEKTGLSGIYTNYIMFIEFIKEFNTNTPEIKLLKLKMFLIRGFIKELIQYHLPNSFYSLYRRNQYQNNSSGMNTKDQKVIINMDYTCGLLDILSIIQISIKNEYEKKIKEHERDKAETKVQERNRILSNLSHTIKNLVSTIIDPLSNLKEHKKYKDVVIDNALKGADLIREIVNAMNLSFKGSLGDFKYDTLNNQGEGSISIYDIIIESLKHSITNMFDSKYFSNFMRNYFPNKEIFNEAKGSWNQTTSDDEILHFAREYMFDISLKIDSAKNLIVGNKKGSALKFQILFQEIILNAVKYASFVNKDDRNVSIKFIIIKNKVHFEVSNSFKKGELTKTTGLGKIIIENFAKLLETEVDIRETEKKFVLSVAFENLWRE